MRLIDADELLKAVDKERDYLKARGQTGAEHILVHNFRDLIDNAPTVELPNYGGQVVPDTLQGWRYEERPTGEWVWTSCNPYDEHIGRWSCSICNYEPDGKLIDEYVYCPNCGARMEVENDE